MSDEIIRLNLIIYLRCVISICDTSISLSYGISISYKYRSNQLMIESFTKYLGPLLIIISFTINK